MNSAEVNSQLRHCTVRLIGSAIEATVLNFSTGDAPQLFVRYASGKTEWVNADRWEKVGDPVDLPRIERNTVPKIAYAAPTK